MEDIRITYTGRKPDVPIACIGIVGDNEACVVRFALNGVPNGDVYVKLAGRTITGKLRLERAADGDYVLPITRSVLAIGERMVVQVQIENVDGMVWQSDADLSFVAGISILADAAIANQQRPYLQDLDARVSTNADAAQAAATSAGADANIAKTQCNAAVAAADKIIGMSVAAATLDAGAAATAAWDGVTGMLALGVPQGLRGERGIQGSKGDTGTTGVQGIPGLDLTVTQILTDAQKLQARVNIGAVSLAQAISIAQSAGVLADSWSQVQQLIRQGPGAQVLPVGTQLQCSHRDYGTLIWDVVAHDQYPDPTGRQPHSMTLLMHDCIYGRQMDDREALYCVDAAIWPDGMPAGIYNFTVAAQAWYTADNGVTYQFALTAAAPVGAQIVLNMTYNQTLDGKTVRVHASSITTTISETATLSVGSGGTSLGTTDGHSPRVNHMHRAIWGSNNYGESALRQWLCGSAAANSWWQPQTGFDRPVAYANVAGFLAGIDASFAAVLGEVDITTARNAVYEIGGVTGGSYITRDKVFLASMQELGLGVNNGVAEGSLMDYYTGAAQAERIKYDQAAKTIARYWWLRSPYPSSASGSWLVVPSGALGGDGAYNGYGAAAVCVIY